MTDEQEALAKLKRHRLRLCQNIEECEKRFGDAPEIRTLRDALKHIDEIITKAEIKPQLES